MDDIVNIIYSEKNLSKLSEKFTSFFDDIGDSQNAQNACKTWLRKKMTNIIDQIKQNNMIKHYQNLKSLNLDNEEWIEVIIDNQKIENYYVSSLGRFMNKKGIIMKDYKPHHSGYIYLRVNIKKYALHRLVAQTFIPNLENKPFVNHIDGNKTNNSVKNLEWATCSENNLHNHKIGLTKGHTRQIIQYDLEMNEIKTFDKILDASKELNICYSSIKAVLYKKQKTAGGFIFKYLD